MKKLSIVFLSTAFLFSACGTPEPVTPESTRIVLPTSTPTPNLLDLRATQRIATVNSIRTASPTLLPTHPPTLTATLRSTEEAMQAAILAEYCPGSEGFYSFSHSRTGRFVAFVCDTPMLPDISRTIVVSADNSKTPVIVSYRLDYLEIPYDEPLPEYYESLLDDGDPVYDLQLSPTRWSADDRYLFLTHPSRIDGLQYGCIHAMVRLEIGTGELLPVFDRGCFSYGFSSDGTALFYVNQWNQPMQVVLVNLATGDSDRFVLDDPTLVEAGYLYLSPDGNRLVVSVFSPDNGFAILLLDRRSESEIHLYQNQNHSEVYSQGWIDNVTISLVDLSIPSQPYYHLNVDTMEKVPAPEP